MTDDDVQVEGLKNLLIGKILDRRACVLELTTDESLKVDTRKLVAIQQEIDAIERALINEESMRKRGK